MSIARGSLGWTAVDSPIVGFLRVKSPIPDEREWGFFLGLDYEIGVGLITLILRLNFLLVMAVYFGT